MIGRRAVLALLLASPLAARAEAVRADEPCCGPVTAGGERLRRFLDAIGVETLWLAGYRVNWRTGEAIAAWPAGSGAHTHCSAFAGAAAMRLGVYLLRPPEHRQTLLANAQMAWLRGPDAAADGWSPLADVYAAQAAADAGRLTVAVFENPNPQKAGHIAIVRPGPIARATLTTDGPMVTQAGGHNFTSVSLARGFSQHRSAWISGGGGLVRFFAHEIDWSQVPASNQ